MYYLILITLICLLLQGHTFCTNVESYLQVSDGVVLFLHDLGHITTSYEYLFTSLASTGLAVIGFDLRGYGITWRGGELPCRVIYESEAHDNDDTRDGLRCSPRKAGIVPPMSLPKDLKSSAPILRNTRSQLCSDGHPNITAANKRTICASSPQGKKCDFGGLEAVRRDIDHLIYYLLCKTHETSHLILMGDGMGGLLALDYLHKGSLKHLLSASVIFSPSFDPSIYTKQADYRNWMGTTLLGRLYRGYDSAKEAQNTCMSRENGVELSLFQKMLLDPKSSALDIMTSTIILQKNGTNESDNAVNFVKRQNSMMVSLEIIQDSDSNRLCFAQKAKSRYIEFLVRVLNSCRI